MTTIDMRNRLINGVVLSLALVSGVGCISATEPWSLEKCVDYAIEHNITVKSSELQVAGAELDVTAARDAFLPTVSGNVSEGVNFGRGLTSDNTYANRNTSTFQWGASLALPLFHGMQNIRQVKVSRIALQQTLLEHEAAKDNVTLNVIAQYLQVLYTKEVARTAQAQLEYSTFEVERQRQMVEDGKIAEATLYDAEAQQARDKLQLLTAESDVRIAVVNLANLLQLPTADGLDVMPLDEKHPVLPGPDIVYSRAMEVNHSILAARAGIETANERISLARSSYIPRLDFDASVGSTFYTIAGLDHDSFGLQMRNNFSTYLGVRLTVPIFDAFSTRNNVRKSRLNQISAMLELDRRADDLYKNIQLAYTQAACARDRYVTSEETLDKTRLSFEATREKYALGRATSADYELAKNNLFDVEVTRITARYEYLLRYNILKFYETNHLQ